MIKVYVAKIENISKEDENNIIASLSDSARARLGKKRNEELHLASLCALSLVPAEMRCDLDYTEGGRPFFKTLDADISISHSKLFSAVAISDSKRELVGIDVEDFNESRNSYARFFTQNEKNVLESGTHELAIWTKKEALFKHLKNDDINFIALDTTKANTHFITLHLDGAIFTVCTKKKEEITVINNCKF